MATGLTGEGGMAVTEGILFGGVFLALSGLALLVRGILRRPLRVEPTCRRCGFDVRVRDPVQPRCSECGADLALPRAIRLGRRRRWWEVSPVGMGCVVLGVVPLLGWGVARVARVQVEPLLPLWSLLNDLDTGNARVELAAWSELQRRVDGGLLSPDQKRRIFARALTVDAARTERVQVASEQVLGSIWMGGAVSGSLARDYAERRLKLSVTPRRGVVIGDPVPLQLTLDLPALATDAIERSFVVRLKQPVGRRSRSRRPRNLLRRRPRYGGGRAGGSGRG